MQRSDFHYDLPGQLIATHPAPSRSASRLLCLDPGNACLHDRKFTDLPELLAPGDLLVYNDTRVIPARLYGRKPTGGRVEMLVERITGPHSALVHLRAAKTPRPGAILLLDGDLRAEVTGRVEDLFEVKFSGVDSLPDLLERVGHMPLPPYINRMDEPVDRERYQTIYARVPGAVAAPTAGLHFDEELMRRLDARGVDHTCVTLHVGAGTFQPVRVENISEHVMHHEYCVVDSTACGKIVETRRRGGRVVAVGTTAVRALESACRNGDLSPYCGDTNLFITPGYRFRSVDALLTNFHLPESTLLMLVCAFAGYETVMGAYRHAVESGYRFFSYGDAMYISARGAA
jgi:S-adenosylmethionine:tRNA ribosyltransferase-isomerase